MNIELKKDTIHITFNKEMTIATKSESIRFYGIKTIVIETIDVVIGCYTKSEELTGEIFYRIDGNLDVECTNFDDITMQIIENGHISENIFKWNGDKDAKL